MSSQCAKLSFDDGVEQTRVKQDQELMTQRVKIVSAADVDSSLQKMSGSSVIFRSRQTGD